MTDESGPVLLDMPKSVSLEWSEKVDKDGNPYWTARNSGDDYGVYSGEAGYEASVRWETRDGRTIVRNSNERYEVPFETPRSAFQWCEDTALDFERGRIVWINLAITNDWRRANQR